MPEQYFTIQQAAQILQVKERAVQRRCKRYNVGKQAGKYMIPASMLSEWSNGQANIENVQTNSESNMYAPGLHEQPDGTLMQVFTRDEYDTFKRMLIEHKQLKQQVQQLQDWVERFTTYTSQRNTIEAHEKGVISNKQPIEDVEDLAATVQAKRKQIIEKIDKDKAKFSEWLNDL